MSNEKIDAEVWARKDDLSARQTAANVTGYVFEGKEVLIENFIEYAEKIRAWLFTNQKLTVDVTAPKMPETSGTQVLPQPTLAQQKTLEYIAVELKTELNDKLKNEVLDFVEQTYQKRLYPSKIPTADKFVAWYQNKW